MSKSFELLKRSDFQGKYGQCSKCHEMCDVYEPCCPKAVVYFEGNVYAPDDFDTEEEDEHAIHLGAS